MAGSAPTTIAQGFTQDGFAAPVNLLTPAQCQHAMSGLRGDSRLEPLDWDKGLAAADPFIFDLATRPALIGYLRQILGDDIVLWGAQFRTIEVGDRHVWHSDIESAAPQAKFATVWIGLEHTGDCPLELVARSHRVARGVQEVQHQHGRARGQASNDEILTWTRDFDDEARLVRPELADGDAVIFDGRLWHGSPTNRGDKARTALLLQYARGDQPVFIPDLTQLEWPWRLRTDIRPPTVAVSGMPDAEANRLVAPPKTARKPDPIDHFLKNLELPLGRNIKSGWKPHPLFSGVVPAVQEMSCHVSVLEPGCSPHAPHVHVEEEVLMVIDGEARILLADSPDDPAPRVEVLRRGDYSYYPTCRHHTIRNDGAEPLTYLMLKWRSTMRDDDGWLDHSITRLADTPAQETPKPFDPQILFEGATAYLDKLHAHVTDLQPGAGYEPHEDAHDVAIILFDGVIETVGKRLTAPAVTYHAGGTLHGMHNPGAQVARYLVFEFHGKPGQLHAPNEGDEPSVREATPDGKDVAALRRQRDALRDEVRARNAAVSPLARFAAAFGRRRGPTRGQD